jgi:hypothetical protein
MTAAAAVWPGAQRLEFSPASDYFRVGFRCGVSLAASDEASVYIDAATKVNQNNA